MMTMVGGNYWVVIVGEYGCMVMVHGGVCIEIIGGCGGVNGGSVDVCGGSFVGGGYCSGCGCGAGCGSGGHGGWVRCD